MTQASVATETMIEAPDIVVVGSIALDNIETTREKREGVLGGSASYACAAASL